ncbi:hypothetical protein FRAAL2515 [Frankia alni ACN14a]|uniref:SRPBCC family protein n=1 Tax=Frankia alni (strain DSM 45986 / CECT 9034 / ACN14a) TaxID=326424 RepID=Q0RMT5_FRAAA|nr:hypothetical protein FRAAL2515 [Frankia alni ACN14a]
MGDVASSRRHVWVEAAAERVWALVGDPGAIAAWFPSIVACEMSGSTRTCTLRSGEVVAEEIITVDDALMRLQYRIVRGIDVESHLGTVDVIPDGNHRCLVLYATDVRPDDLAGPLGTSVERALDLLAERFEQPSTRPD